MQELDPLEVGVMFWAGADPSTTLSELGRLGFRCGQLGVPGTLDLSCAAEWKEAAQQAGFTIYTVVVAFEGESYADIPTVKDTVGFIPQRTRAAREARILAVSDFAAELGVPAIMAHVGFIPEDSASPDHQAVLELVQRICDHAATHGQTFALETGQEPANVLLEFLRSANRNNLGINFDPANMILYGTGDPVAALALLGPHLLSVHAKDGDWPPADNANALGTERPLGKGAVGIERFLAALHSTRYRGPIAIEREIEDPVQRIADITSARNLLRSMLER